MKRKLTHAILFVLILTVNVNAQKSDRQHLIVIEPAKVWSIQKAHDWYSQHQWITGANYIPHTAINQLEMWQAETFDPKTIDTELGWARDIGFNTSGYTFTTLHGNRISRGLKIA